MPFDQTNYQPEPIGRQRLRILADFLPTVPDEQFDLRDWAAERDFAECGSAGCACGWATTIPEFKVAGLRMKLDGDGTIYPTYRKQVGFDAVCRFFRIDIGTALHLFSSDHYVRADGTPAGVAARIRGHLAQTADASSAVRAA